MPEQDRHPHVAPAAPELPAATLQLVPLVIASPVEGTFVVGDPDVGTFVEMPAEGVAFLRVIQSGGTIESAALAATECAGEPVDAADFIELLRDLGFVASADSPAGESSGQGAGRLSARVNRVRPEVASLLFGRVAWFAYAATAVATFIVMLVASPEYVPSYRDAFFIDNLALASLSLLVLGIPLIVLHELAHGLAGRAAGIRVSFRIARRWHRVVFETDLTGLLAVAPAKRYSPLLAGMAWDVVLLALTAAVRLAHDASVVDIGGLAYGVAEALALTIVLGIGFQFLLFLRTDVYALATTALGTRDLYRTTWLMLRRDIGIDGDAARAELREAHPRDVQVARVYRVALLGGIAWSIWLAATFVLPALLDVASWSAGAIRRSPLSVDFWSGLLALGLMLLEPALLVYVLARDDRGAIRRSGALARRRLASPPLALVVATASIAITLVAFYARVTLPRIRAAGHDLDVFDRAVAGLPGLDSPAFALLPPLLAAAALVGVVDGRPGNAELRLAAGALAAVALATAAALPILAS